MPSILTDRYVSFLRRFRAWVAAAALLVIAAGGALVSRLHIETDWSRLLPYPEHGESFKALSSSGMSSGLLFIFSCADGGPVLKATDYIEESVEQIRASGLFQHIYFSLDSADLPAAPETMLAFIKTNQVRDLVYSLGSNGMAAIIRENIRLLFSPAGGIVKKILRTDPLQLSRVAIAPVQTEAGFAYSQGFMLSPDRTRLLVVGIPKASELDSRWLQRADHLMKKVREASSRRGLACRMPGSLFLRAELFTSVRHDLLKTTFLSLVSVFGFFCWWYRKSSGSIPCLFFPLVAGLALTYALYSLFFQSIDFITALSSAMLIGLGVDFGIHLLARFQDLEGSEEARVAQALREVAPGLASGALTTAAAFVSILITGMRSFYPLGLTAAAGILLTLGAFLVLFPVSVFLFHPGPRPQGASRSGDARLYRASRRLVLPLSLLLLALAPFGFARLFFESDFRMFLPADSHVLQDMKAAGAQTLGRPADGLIVRAASKGYRQDSELAQALAAVVGNTAWQSPFSYLPPIRRLDVLRGEFQARIRAKGLSPKGSAQMLNRIYRANKIRYDTNLNTYISNIYGVFQTDTWERTLYALPLAQAYFTEDRAQFLAIGVHDDGRPWSRGEADRIVALLGRQRPGSAVVAGNLMMESIRARAIPDSLSSAVLALLAITAILYYHFRSWVFCACALTPLALGMATTCALMGWLGISFNFFNLSVLPLIFGLGIDDGIHFIQTFRAYRSTRATFGKTLEPIVLTTLTTCLGFGSLVTVSFRGVAMMGLIVVMGMTACLLATLVALPALTRMLERNTDDDPTQS